MLDPDIVWAAGDPFRSYAYRTALLARLDEPEWPYGVVIRLARGIELRGGVEANGVAQAILG